MFRVVLIDYEAVEKNTSDNFLAVVQQGGNSIGFFSWVTKPSLSFACLSPSRLLLGPNFGQGHPTLGCRPSLGGLKNPIELPPWFTG